MGWQGAAQAVAVIIMLLILLWVAIITNTARIKKTGQRLIYGMAERRAREKRKPLAVVGDPAAPKTLNAYFGAGNGCGDLCIDSSGAPGCPRAERALVLDWLRRQADNSWVVFESEVIHHVPGTELAETIAELKRVSGGDLFSCNANVINIAEYARTGVAQKPSAFSMWRVRNFGRLARAMVEFPPFSADYKYVEFDEKPYDAARAGAVLGGWRRAGW